ncbi:MAG: hypothetical protein KGJ87_01325 [Planctomycetota bacterium]|nr:hypothetical protein [Planctomycetota bacterium]MDE2215796.1 hypothetical protein [Planctomycetota bacterium]
MEENMQDVAQILNNGTNIGILYEIKYNLPEEVKEALLKRVTLVKNGIEAISKRFDLEKEHREATSEPLPSLKAGASGKNP